LFDRGIGEILMDSSVLHAKPAPFGAGTKACMDCLLSLQQSAESGRGRLCQDPRVPIFDETPSLEYQDAIERSCFGYFVRHVQQSGGRPSLSDIAQECPASLTLEAHERLIENHQPGPMPKHRTGQSDALGFTRRQEGSAFANERRESIRQLGDH
jgi:hypothetical protein